MFIVGQKVKVRGEKSYRGIIIYAAHQFGWYSIRDNKGREHNVVPSNVIESRNDRWQKSGS